MEVADKYDYKDDDPTYEHNNWNCPTKVLRTRLRYAEQTLSQERAMYREYLEMAKYCRRHLSAHGRVAARLRRILEEREAGTGKKSGEPTRKRDWDETHAPL